MPAFCGVVNCGHRSERDKKSFYRLPAALNRGSDFIKQISRDRREKWLSAIKRDDMTESKQKWLRICEAHFITGKPASLEDVDHPDWVPSVNMGYATNNINSISRYERRVKRLRSDLDDTVLSTTNNSDDDTREEHCAPVVQKNPSIETQTELTMEDIDKISKDYQDVLSELCEVKGKLAHMSLNETSFKNNEEKMKYYVGIPKFTTLLIVFDLIKQYISETHMSNLNKFQQFILTLMHLRLNLDFTDSGYRFGVSKSTACRIFTKCLYILNERLCKFVFWPERSELMKNVPESFLEAFGRKVTVVIDCFEIKIEKPCNLTAAAQCYSHYKHTNTIKYLIGISPQGAIIFISSAWGGRASDKYIVQNCNVLEKLLPGDLVLADRGFNIKEEVELYCAEIKVPAFTKGKTQLSALEVESTRNLAHVRIHVERVIGQLRKKFRILTDKMPITLVKKTNENAPATVDQIVMVCCCLINLMPSVIPVE